MHTDYLLKLNVFTHSDLGVINLKMTQMLWIMQRSHKPSSKYLIMLWVFHYGQHNQLAVHVALMMR